MIIKEKGKDGEEEKEEEEEEEKYEIPDDDADSEEEFKGAGPLYFGFNRGTRYNQTLLQYDHKTKKVLELKHKNNQF